MLKIFDSFKHQIKGNRNTKDCRYRYFKKIQTSNFKIESQICFKTFVSDTNALSNANVFLLTKQNSRKESELTTEHMTKTQRDFLLAVINDRPIMPTDVSIPERRISMFTKVA